MPTPPQPDKRPNTVSSPQGDRIDEYYWLRDDTREDPEILAHLRAENRYLEAVLEPASELRETLYQELVHRIPNDEAAPPVFERGYWYQSRFEGDFEHSIHGRRKETRDAPEEILLDENQLAVGHEYFYLGDYDVSPSNGLLAYSQDVVGRGQYEIRVLDLDTREQLIEPIPNTTGSVVWAGDNRTFFYIEKDPVTLLGVRLRRHRLGESGEDPIVYEEHDASFYMGITLSGDRRFVMLLLSSTTADEVWVVPAAEPGRALEVLLPRQPNHEYEVDHIDSRWIIRTNWQAENFRIMVAADDAVGDRTKWKQLVAHREETLIADFELFDSFFVMGERADAMRRLAIHRWDGSSATHIDVGESIHTAWIGANPEQSSDWLRFGYTSMTTPYTICAHNMKTGRRKVLKRQEVKGGFDPDAYVSSRRFATAADGARIPISLVHRRDTPLDGSAPSYIYGYGAYGSSTDPEFARSMLSLLDRGFVYALAHVRGGEDLGRRWYLDGRQEAKMNSFTDFNAVAQALADDGLVDRHRMVAAGGSAGGLLVTAAVNLRPDLFRAVVADVPFVDVVTTMLDESIPLTTNEYEEWGNPNDPDAYAWTLAYSPYDNLRETDYPTMLVTTGLWDSQVQYFEPVKYVARLRDRKTDDRPVVLYVDLDSGHGGASGRFKRQRERALEFAFVVQAAS